MKSQITKELLISLLEEGLSGNKIGKQLGCSGTCIRQYMKKYKLHSNFQSIQDKKCFRTGTHKQCPRCSNILELKNFDKRPNGNLQSYCKKCINDNSYKSFKDNKLILIKEFGNCCCKCGYNKNSSALEFHHLDPTKKDFHISKSYTKNLDKIRKEIEKCILVCSNCHREIHYPDNSLLS